MSRLNFIKQHFRFSKSDTGKSGIEAKSERKGKQRKGRVLEWGTGLLPAAGVPALHKFTLINLYSWALCLILVALYIIILMGISKGSPRIMWQKIKSKSIHHVAISLILCSFLGTGIMKIVDARTTYELQEETYKHYCAEKTYIKNGTKGLREFHEGRYLAALDSLRLYADTSAVAAYYYGLILYNGYNVEPDYITGLKYIELAAQQHYFRAVYELLQYNIKLGNSEAVLKYAEMYLSARLTHFMAFPDEIGKDIEIGPELDYWNFEINCYNNIYSYYAAIKPDLSMLLHWIGVFHEPYINQKDNIYWEKKKIENTALAYWLTGHCAKGSNIMKRLVKKYPEDARLHTEYGKMLINCPSPEHIINMEELSFSKIQKAEKHFLEGLKLASKNYNINQQFICAKYLEKLYRATGYLDDAKQMNHLSSDLSINMYYEELSK